MENNKSKNHLFNDYLETKECDIQKELEPYYQRVRDREESRSNLYGVAYPSDEVLLEELASVQKLRKKASVCASLEELIIKIESEIRESKEKAAIYDFQIQLQYIDEYQKNCENAFGITSSDIDDPQSLSETNTIDEIQVPMENESNKVKK